MSWDALILSGEGTVGSLVGVPRDWKPSPLGGRDQVRATLEQCLPEIEWVTGRDYGALESQEFAIEFRLPDEEPVRAITVRVVGHGDPIRVLLELCRTNGWVVFDNQAGDLCG
jgi:hypothetical protein